MAGAGFSASEGPAPNLLITRAVCAASVPKRCSSPKQSGEGGRQMFRQLRSQKGLTLVELMVVVAIIAIIAAVAITVFQDIQKKAKLAADQANVASMRSAVAIYYGKKNGLFPPNTASVYGLVTPTLTAVLHPTGAWHYGEPTYVNTNGKVDYTFGIGSCP